MAESYRISFIGYYFLVQSHLIDNNNFMQTLIFSFSHLTHLSPQIIQYNYDSNVQLSNDTIRLITTPITYNNNDKSVFANCICI